MRWERYICPLPPRSVSCEHHKAIYKFVTKGTREIAQNVAADSVAPNKSAK